MEQRPLPESALELSVAEPRLELVPALEDETETETAAVAEAEEVVEEVDDDEEVPEAPEATQDPLKLYVRQIGDGRLLHPRRSGSSPGARTPATRRRRSA